MKSKFFNMAAILALFSVFTLNSAFAAVIYQDDFEDGTLAPWSVTSGTPSITMADANSGLYSVMADGSSEITLSFGALLTDTITELSIWVKRDEFLFDYVTLTYSDNSTDEGTFINQGNPNNEWVKFDFVGNLTAGKSLVSFGIFGTSPGPTYFDDFTLSAERQQIPEPSTLALLALALLGLRMRRATR